MVPSQHLEIAVDVSTEYGRVPFVAISTMCWSTRRRTRLTRWTNVGEPLGRAASAFCSAWFCRKRAETAHQLAVKLRRELLGDHSPERPQRLVVSLSTLPGRISFLKDQLRFLYAQTRKPDAICGGPLFVAAGQRSLRDTADHLYEEADAGRIVILRTQVDWGPATKLIPHVILSRRTRARSSSRSTTI